MAEGAFFNGACHASQGEALDAYYGSVAPASVPGSPAYVSMFEKGASGWLLKRYSMDASGQLVSLGQAAAPVVSFPVCDTYASFKDGMSLGWGVVSAMIAAAVNMHLKRGL